MPTISDVADKLIAADLPVVFLDTCILLDVVRAVKRQNKDCVASAEALRQAVAAKPAKCQSVVSFLVRQEWREHHPKLVGEAAKHLGDLDCQSSYFHDACEIPKVDPGFARANYAGCEVAERLGELSGSLLDCSLEVDPDHACR